jgi:hypothetical protein
MITSPEKPKDKNQNQNQNIKNLFLGTGGSAPRNAPLLKPTTLKNAAPLRGAYPKTYIPYGILKSTSTPQKKGGHTSPPLPSFHQNII